MEKWNRQIIILETSFRQQQALDISIILYSLTPQRKIPYSVTSLRTK
uniref:Uncharacterized protein n=1 Tax=Rhizophora mucronata TaxID=61149 RepID=A0A2P2MTI4_RHIMU